MSNQKRGQDKTGGGKATMKDLQPKAQEDIILYSLFAGFTRFIPLPFVDNKAENHMERLMMTKIAHAYGVPVKKKDIKTLATRTKHHSIKNFAKGSAKKLLKKVTVIFQAKDAGDEFGLSYGAGYLMDYACAMGFVGRYSAKALREAMDKACSQTDSGPLGESVAKILKGSPLIFTAIKKFIEGMGKDKKQPDDLTDGVSQEMPTEANDAVQKICAEMDVVPPSYFQELRQSLVKALGA